MCKYAKAQQIKGAVVWIPKRSWPQQELVHPCHGSTGHTLVNYKINFEGSPRDQVIAAAQAEGRKRIQRSMREWPLCPEGGNVNLEWKRRGGQRTYRGYFKCDTCDDWTDDTSSTQPHVEENKWHTITESKAWEAPIIEPKTVPCYNTNFWVRSRWGWR